MAEAKYFFPEIGVDFTFDGILKVLREEPGHPTVFLLDEHHHHPSVEANIALGEIILPKRIAVLGVESHFARGDISEENRANEDPRFANHFHSKGRCVVGVESQQLFELLKSDVKEGRWPDIKTHPYNYLRSHFFLFELFQAWRLGGDKFAPYHMLLNAGRYHNDHIELMVNRGEVDEIAGQKASYVRVRSAAYPA